MQKSGGNPPQAAPGPEVIQRGGDILQSGIFARAMQEPHHWTSVGEHSLGVAQAALRIAGFLERFGLRPDRDVLVRCALCHDFGIIDRTKKYGDSARRCCREHPKDSLRAYEQHIRPATPAEADCILHHMFPMRPIPPHTLEGAIINWADKAASVKEALGRRRKKPRKAEE